MILVGRSTLLNVQVKMNSFWVVVLCSLAVMVVDAKKVRLACRALRSGKIILQEFFNFSDEVYKL